MANETELVRELREKTGAGIMECRRALQETSWDVEKAVDQLRKRGAQIAQKKIGRATRAGKVESYIHMGGKIGVLVEINCETDFVARTDDFQQLVKEVALQIAAANPQCVERSQVSAERLDREKAIYRESVQGKPENIVEKIVTGKLEKFYQEACLLEQLFIKDDTKTIQSLMNDMIAKTGENIVIKRFARFVLGE